MSIRHRMMVAILLAASGSTASAATKDDLRTSMAVAVDSFLSVDAEKTEVQKLGLNADVRYHGPEDYLGFRLEAARYQPLGQKWYDRQRLFLRGAGEVAPGWKGSASIGTDGHDVIGSASLHDEAKFRKEFFIERDLVESPLGLSRGIYYTFAGVALDLPADDNNVLTLVGGVQEFTGDNVRLHLRATAVHVLNPDSGLSIQLRTRYFHDSEPHEYDYYSPRWYASAIPVLQMRRWINGWQTLIAGGVGVQRDDASKWHRSSYFNASVTSPPRRGWSGNAAVLFSETPTVAGDNYNYFQFSAGVRRAF